MISKHLLIFAYYFPPENTSAATRPGQFVKYLPGFGYRASVISGAHVSDPQADDVWRVPDPCETSTLLTCAARTAELAQRYAAPYDDRLPWVPHAVARASKILHSEDPVPIVLSSSPPVATHLAALWIHRRYRVKWVADFQDPLWGNPGRTRSLAHVYDQRIERMIFARADAVIANTETVAGLWRSRHPRWSRKISTIMNGFDPEDVFPPSSLVTPRVHQVIAHVGALYGGRRPGPFLSAVERIITRGLADPAKLRIRLIGPMEDTCCDRRRPPFSSLAEQGCLYRSPGTVPIAEARIEMAEADCLLLLDLNDLGASLQVPAKLYDYLRAGRPILALTPHNSPTRHILEQSGVTHVCVDGQASPEHIDEALLKTLSLSRENRRASDWFWTEFDARTQTQRLARIMDRLLDSQSSRSVA